ncbi:S41 family peptidase [Caldisericum sp. AR60]|uniref:S41 family peptidase n=1 Tax=Caldisericum sp. AR60 TaxID=3397852 RepID=UPI0039FD148A
MKRNIILIVILLIMISFIAGYFVGFRYPLGVSQTGSHILLTRTADYLLSNFYKPITEDELIKGMVNSLNDPYTVFMNPEETKALQEEVKGEYAGIGVVINKNEKLNYPEIVTVFKGSPAEKSGLLEGDIILEVDGVSTFGLTLDEVASKVKGKIGTQVVLKIKRDSKELTFNVTREKINIPLTDTRYYENGKIGYLKIFMFSEGASNDVKKTLDEFKQKNVRGIILDLRGNPGGLLSECENIASQLIPSGVLLYTKDRSGKLTPITVNGKKLNIPMVVLVDQGTASASEILTGALKYYKVAKVIGEKTFGKGVIQQIFPLPQSYSIKITVEEYLLPDKTSINGKGITPDIEINNNPNTKEDEQLNKALELLKP